MNYSLPLRLAIWSYFCSAVAVVVPYRERDLHLRAFLSHIHPFLQKQQLNYTIYIVEQVTFITIVYMWYVM